MAKRKETKIETDEISMESVLQESGEEIETVSGEVELIPYTEEVEMLSEEAKQKQEQAILSAREQAATLVDRKKIPLAIREINAVERASQILDDEEVWDRVKESINNAKDLKYLAEAQKLHLSNLQNLLRMDSVDTNGTAGEVFVGVQFGSGGSGTTHIVVRK